MSEAIVNESATSSVNADWQQIKATLTEQMQDADAVIDRLHRILEHIEEAHGMASVGSVMRFMIESGFLNAPASTRYHLAYAGGLLVHSINVAESLENLANIAGISTRGECATIGLLHDFCKADSYVYNAEKNRFSWNYDSRLDDVSDPDEHGELSAKRVRNLIETLTEEEAAAIEWHMGLYDHRIVLPHGEVNADQIDAAKKARHSYDAACKQFPIVKIANVADMIASQVMEYGK